MFVHKEKTVEPKPFFLRKKIFISIFSLAFFLVLLELTLRFVGYVYLSMRVSPAAEFLRLKEKGICTILCVGDSFTFGGDLPLEHSYPFQLEKILNSKNSDTVFSVVNAGVCEQNSAQLLKALPGKISFYRPDAVILLVGASNWFNFIGFNKNKSFFLRLKETLYGFRVYKIAKIIALNLEQRFLITRFKDKANPKFYKFLYYYSSFRPVIDPDRSVFFEEAEMRLQRVECLHQIGEKEKAADLFNKILKIDPNSDLFMYQTADFLMNMNRSLGIGEGLKYDPNLITDAFKERLENNPNVKDKRLNDYFLFFKSIQNSYRNEDIKKRLREDMEEIVGICKTNNIKLILQDYPFPYPLADGVLREIASKYSLPLVRNAEVFGNLLAKEKKEAYFLNDTHCTSLGYGVMAENISKLFFSKSFFQNNHIQN